MTLEIEAKVQVDTFEPILQRLAQHGGRWLGSYQQNDIYFTDTEKRLIQSGCGLRVRQQRCGEQSLSVVTFKGPRQPGPFKTRLELETSVGDGQILCRILEQLGLKPLLTVSKNRQEWQFMECLVCLDEVAELGLFVEIEAAGEQLIRSALEKLQLNHLPIIKQGYAELLSCKMKLADGGVTS